MILYSGRKKIAEDFEEYLKTPLKNGLYIEDSHVNLVSYLQSAGYLHKPDEIASLRAEVDQYKADIEAGRLVRLEQGDGYWYCPRCQEEVGAYSVTYQELHDRCGHTVLWVEPMVRAALEGGQQ